MGEKTLTDKKISVIVPVYNVENYVDRCIKSIVNQTHKNLEIIIVDDGSPDRCPEICDRWAKSDNRIQVIHKRNEGVAKARFDGLSASTGEYIAFVDSDDWADEDMYEYLLKIMEMTGSQVASVSAKIIDESDDGEMKDTSVNEEEIQVYDNVETIKNMNKGLMSVTKKLYKRSLFDHLPKIDFSIKFAEDSMLNGLLYKNVDSLVVSNLKKYNYFRHGDSAISGVLTSRIVEDTIKAFNFLLSHIDKNSEVYQYYMANKIISDFFLLNSIIRNNKCLDRYDYLRNDIIKNKDYIFKKDSNVVFNKRQKLGVVLLAISPKLYNKSILIRREIRGF